MNTFEWTVCEAIIWYFIWAAITVLNLHVFVGNGRSLKYYFFDFEIKVVKDETGDESWRKV